VLYLAEYQPQQAKHIRIPHDGGAKEEAEYQRHCRKQQGEHEGQWKK
jgi:hypothetical protein